MSRLAELPTFQPAANERAPRRKPRINWALMKAQKLARQEAFLAFIRAGESKARAAFRTRVELQTVDDWRGKDPEFAQLYQKAQEDGQAMLERRVNGLLPMAIDVAEETLSDEDVKLRWDAAFRLMKGRGLLRDADAPVVAIDNRVLSISVIDQHTADLLGQIGERAGKLEVGEDAQEHI